MNTSHFISQLSVGDWILNIFLCAVCLLLIWIYKEHEKNNKI